MSESLGSTRAHFREAGSWMMYDWQPSFLNCLSPNGTGPAPAMLMAAILTRSSLVVGLDELPFHLGKTLLHRGLELVDRIDQGPDRPDLARRYLIGEHDLVAPGLKRDQPQEPAAWDMRADH